MQIKKFEASNMKEALRLVKQAFGTEAVILTAREMGNAKGIFGFAKKPGIEVTAATDTNSMNDKDNHNIRGSLKYSFKKPVRSDSNASGRKKGFVNPFRDRTKKYGKSSSSYLEKKRGRYRDAKELYNSYYQMLEQEVDATIALELTREASRLASLEKSFFSEGLKRCLVQILHEKGVFATRLRINRRKQKLVAVIGPTGVGKTSTIAKLAASAHIRENKHSTALITLDNIKIGAIAQLKVYAKIIGIPIKVASNKIELKRCIEKLNNYDVIFIDTPGVSQKDINQINYVKQTFDRVNNLEYHLAMSAATNDKILRDILKRFSKFNISRIMFTKLDESISYGSILNQLYRTKIPVSYFTNGQQIPEDIEPASIEKLADLLLGAKGKGNFLSGPPETLAKNMIMFEKMLNGSDEDGVFSSDLNGNYINEPFNPISQTISARGNGRYQYSPRKYQKGI